MVTLSHEMLTKLAVRASFEVPQSGMVFFAVRGMLPVDINGTSFLAEHDLQPSPIDHNFMRCTIGQWLPERGTLAVFPGSTVPHISYMKKAQKRGGSGANMLLLGKYLYNKGVHRPGKKGGHRAFRQAQFFPVWRTSDDLDYDIDDILDNDGPNGKNGFVWDNIHCASNSNLDRAWFGSAGCQVVAGSPGRPNSGELGPWKVFIDNAYSKVAKSQSRFEYLLFSGFEVGILDQSPNGKHNRTCRFGSSGHLVSRIQRALQKHGLPEFHKDSAIDGEFGRNTLEAVAAFQNKELGEADGIVGPQTAKLLGIAWEKIDFAKPSSPSAPSVDPIVSQGIDRDWFDAAVRITSGFEVAGDPYKGVTGNFDGMGVSCGALQWNLGSKSLQPMVKAVGEAFVLDKMPKHGVEFWRACNVARSQALKIAKGWHTGGKLKKSVVTELQALMGSSAMRTQQDKAMLRVASKAMRHAENWAQARGNAKATKRTFALFFDIVTQNGSMKGVDYADVRDFIGDQDPALAVEAVCQTLEARSGQSGHVKDAYANAKSWKSLSDLEKVELLVLSHLRASKSLPQWRHVVLNRKGSIAVGRGRVNGTNWNFGKHGL